MSYILDLMSVRAYLLFIQILWYFHWHCPLLSLVWACFLLQPGLTHCFTCVFWQLTGPSTANTKHKCTKHKTWCVQSMVEWDVQWRRLWKAKSQHLLSHFLQWVMGTGQWCPSWHVACSVLAYLWLSNCLLQMSGGHDSFKIHLNTSLKMRE